MARVTIGEAAKSTGLFDVRRFKGSKRERHDAWLGYRTKGVGGSDMSVILGSNPWRTAVELWQEKTGRVTPDDISGRWSVQKGVLLEDGLRRRFQDAHPELKVINGTDVSLVSKAHPCMHASLDGFIYDPETDSWGVLEIKTTNPYSGRMEWHDVDGRLKAPDYYVAQVTHYMAVTGFTWGYFCADIGEAEPIEVRFERDEDDVNAVINAAEEFWGFVERDEMPELTGVDVANVYPNPQPDIVDMSSREDVRALLDEYDAAKAAVKDAKDEESRLKDELLVVIGDHTGVKAGGYEATYKPFKRAGYTRTVEPAEGRTFRFRALSSKEQ